MRTPPSACASRPVTSAVIAPRSRKSGRSRLKATDIPPPNATRISRIAPVSFQLSQKSTPTAITPVSVLPTSCTRPVPTRFRIPSASFMIREMSTPLWVLSKYATGSRSTCACTRLRISVIARCAATLITWVSE
jgi:hypothetical protein